PAPAPWCAAVAGELLAASIARSLPLAEPEREAGTRRDDRRGHDRGRDRRDRAADGAGTRIDLPRRPRRPGHRDPGCAGGEGDRPSPRTPELPDGEGGPIRELDRGHPADQEIERAKVRARSRGVVYR